MEGEDLNGLSYHVRRFVFKNLMYN